MSRRKVAEAAADAPLTPRCERSGEDGLKLFMAVWLRASRERDPGAFVVDAPVLRWHLMLRACVRGLGKGEKLTKPTAITSGVAPKSSRLARSFFTTGTAG